MAPDRGGSKRLDVRSKPLKRNGVERAKKKQASLGRQIRDIQRLLKLNLSQEVRQAQESRLKQLKDSSSQNTMPQQPSAKVDRRDSKRYKQVKFVERRKIERGLRRADKELKSAQDDESREQVQARIQELQQDLEYIKFFPKNEKYVSLFMENADSQAIARREKLRETIRANIAAAAAAGVELEEEETGSEDDANDSATDMSEDEFFAKGNSDAEEEADNPVRSRVTQTNQEPAETKHQQTEIRQQQQRPLHNKRKMDKLEQQNVATGRVTQDSTVTTPGNLGEKRKRKRKRPKKK